MTQDQDLSKASSPIKTAEEIELLRRAAIASSEAIAYAAGELIQIGRSEIVISNGIDAWGTLNYPGSKLAFETIVAAGAGGSEPHHVPTDYILKSGDFVTIDFGLEIDGWCGDITRTFVLGADAGGGSAPPPASPSETELHQIYDLVMSAQLAALQSARAGITCKELDAICRDIITGGGYGKYFPHGTGHSLGHLVHEAPYVNARDDTMLAEGMVVTIEPGIYVEGLGGVRIEDDVLITSTGCEILTDYPRELIQI